MSAASSWSVVGAGAWAALWAGQLAGYAGLVYGVGGHDQNVTRGHQLVLTPGGYVVLLLVTVVLLALMKFSPKINKGKVVGGFIAGCCLGLTGTIAGAAAVPLASGANLLGAAFTQAFV
jgi:hypothetical protein